MKAQEEWHCWQITRCGKEDSCIVRRQGFANRPCWDIVQEMDDYRSALNVCKDCLVFISKKSRPGLSEEEVQEIMAQKVESVLAPAGSQTEE